MKNITIILTINNKIFFTKVNYDKNYIKSELEDTSTENINGKANELTLIILKKWILNNIKTLELFLNECESASDFDKLNVYIKKKNKTKIIEFIIKKSNFIFDKIKKRIINGKIDNNNILPIGVLKKKKKKNKYNKRFNKKRTI